MRVGGIVLVMLASALAGGCPATPPPASNLVDMVKSKTPCRVTLNPAWAGQAHDTLSIGPAATIAEPAELRKHRFKLRFDRFSYSETVQPLHFARSKWLTQIRNRPQMNAD